MKCWRNFRRGSVRLSLWLLTVILLRLWWHYQPSANRKMYHIVSCRVRQDLEEPVVLKDRWLQHALYSNKVLPFRAKLHNWKTLWSNLMCDKCLLSKFVREWKDKILNTVSSGVSVTFWCEPNHSNQVYLLLFFPVQEIRFYIFLIHIK